MEGFGQGFRHHPYHLQAHQQVKRRYTSSGAAQTKLLTTKQQQQLNDAEQCCRQAPQIDCTPTPDLRPRLLLGTQLLLLLAGTVQSSLGSKLYPNTWFEVQALADAGDNSKEPICY
jgi:hypothetical protein